MKIIENSETNSNTLYIPANIKTRFEFISGFGMSELCVTAVIVAICIVLVAIFKPSISNSVLIVLITGAATGMAIKKSEINQSITDLIMLFFRFTGTQQKYKYEFKSKYTFRGEIK